MKIKNRSAFFHYFIQSTYIAGVQLVGGEVKSIRAGKASFGDSYCQFDQRHELWIKNLYIAPYNSQHASVQMDTRRDRKLLLHQQELRKIEKQIKEKSVTLVPLSLFLQEENQKIKVEIALAKGKKHADKRQAIREREEKKKIAKHTNH